MPPLSATALSAGICLGCASLAAAFDNVSTADVFASVARGNGEIAVHLSYRIVATDTVDRIPISLLRVAQTHISDITATWDGEPAAMRWEPGEGLMRRGTVEIPSARSGGPVTDLKFEYLVSQSSGVGATSSSLHLPLAQVDLKPETTAADVFFAEVAIPSGMSLVESFPVGAQAITTTSDDVRYRIKLPVIPSFLRLELRAGDRLFTVPRVVDGIVVTLIFVLCLVGLGRLRAFQNR